MANFKKLFPVNFEKNSTPECLKSYLNILSKKCKANTPRVTSKSNTLDKDSLLQKYSELPLNCNDPFKKGKEIVEDFFDGFLNWRSTYLNFNIGSAVNVVASSLHAISNDSNIIAVNKGLAGKVIVAEKAVSNILGNLIGKKNIRTIFTYGGSGTNLYGMKLGIQKAMPKSNREGITKEVKVLITEDSHYAHVYSADWLGIGTNNVIKIKAGKDRTSCIEHAEKIMRNLLEKKILIGAILINGGTSYFHSIDNIKNFVKLRNKLVKEYHLGYIPHIHVDAVIGWMWLFFEGYNFKKNPLNIGQNCLRKIEIQYKKIAQIKYADSWGVDFHKGVGGCPVVSSAFVFNNENDLILFSKKHNPIPGIFGLHQISERFDPESPVNYTLENSRSSGPFLSALGSLHSMGKNGFRILISRLVGNASYIEKLVEKRDDVDFKTPYQYGFVVMLRLYPKKYAKKKYKTKELYDIELVNEINNYNQEFFKWDKETRTSKNNSPECAYSHFCFELPCGIGLHTLKIYPVSPHVNKKDTRKLINTIISQKDIFDKLKQND